MPTSLGEYDRLDSASGRSLGTSNRLIYIPRPLESVIPFLLLTLNKAEKANPVAQSALSPTQLKNGMMLRAELKGEKRGWLDAIIGGGKEFQVFR